jgi:hypothetical protein
MVRTYDGFPTHSTKTSPDKLTSRQTLYNIAKKANPMSHRHHNAQNLRARHLTSRPPHHPTSIYKLPYSRSPQTPLPNSIDPLKALGGHLHLTAPTNSENINIIDQLELTSSPPKKIEKFEAVGGKSLIHSRKQNSLVASSCLNRSQKMPVKIQVNLNNNIFPVKIDGFERTVGELCSSDERGVGSVHEIKNLKTRFESLVNERASVCKFF